jgi:UDP-glucose 4-epimerase
LSFFLVTGGAGFIGSHLVDALLGGGHRVRVLDDFSTGKRENLPSAAEVIVGDVADPDTVARALRGADGCFHLAAIASVQRANEDWLGTHRVNLGGTIAVLDAARARGASPAIPVVYASSAAVYGDLGNRSAAESCQPQPQTAYGADKLGSELHAAIAWRVHGVPTLGLRFFNVYGRRQDPQSPYSGVISIFAHRIAQGLQITLHGDGGQTRDFVHVSDVVAHLYESMRLLTNTPGAYVLNVCTGRETSINSLAAILAALHGIHVSMVHATARHGDIRRSVGDPSRARAQLGVAAAIGLEWGLQDLVGLRDDFASDPSITASRHLTTST